MKSPESHLAAIAKLRQEHTANYQMGDFKENYEIRTKIINEWEGYHAAIDWLLDQAGCATGNEHEKYSQVERIQHLVNQRDYFLKKSEQ